MKLGVRPAGLAGGFVIRLVDWVVLLGADVIGSRFLFPVGRLS